MDDLRTSVQAAARQQLPGVTAAAKVFVNRILSDADHEPTSSINATEIIAPGGFHLPLAETAIAAMSEAAEGSAGISHSVESLVCKLTGAEAAIVLHSASAAATVVMASVGDPVIVARDHVGEIDGVSLVELTAAANADLIEIGVVGRVCREDYHAAMRENEGACVWYAKPFSKAMIGDVSELVSDEVFAVARDQRCVSVEFLECATLVQIDFGNPGCTIPSVRASLLAGADAVVCGGERFNGGPPCGIVVGSADLIEAIADHPLARASGIDPLRAAALAATLRLTSESTQCAPIPALQFLSATTDHLRHRAERLATQLKSCAVVATSEVVATTSFLNDGRLVHQQIPGFGVAITIADMSTDTTAKKLLDSRPSIAIQQASGRILIHLRNVVPRQDEQILTAFRAFGPASPAS